jgi:exosortase
MQTPTDALETGAPAVSRRAAPLAIDRWATAIVGLFWLELTWRLQMEWSVNPQYNYGWAVPFLAAFLLWRRWTNAPAPGRPDAKWVGVVVMIAGAFVVVPVRLIQEANPDWRLMSWTMAVATVLITLAAIFLAGGFPWLRHFSFPIVFFLVSVPWPVQFEQLIIQGLMRADAAINVEILNAIGIPAVQLGNVIEVGTGFVGIDEACTGVRSLQATFMVSLFLGEFYGFGLSRRVLLVLSGAALAFGCNLVRTFLLVSLGAEHGSEMIARWHDPAGYSILFVCLFALWALSLLFGGNQRREHEAPPVSQRPRQLPRYYLVALGILLLVAEVGTQVWYSAHEKNVAKTPSWTIKWPEQAKDFQRVPVAESAQDLLRYNEGGGASWSSADGHQWAMYFFRWLPGRTAGLYVTNHRPDICLPASGMTQRGGVDEKVVTINGVTLPIRGYVFEKQGRLLHVYYCYWDGSSAAARAGAENWAASGRLEKVFRGKRDIGTQMLEIVVAGYEDAVTAEKAVRAELGRIIRSA